MRKFDTNKEKSNPVRNFSYTFFTLANTKIYNFFLKNYIFLFGSVSVWCF